MAIKDIRSEVLPKFAFGAVFGINNTLTGGIIDTADFDGGLMFTSMAVLYTDGTYTFTLEEDDDALFGGNPTVIPNERLIGTIEGLTLTGPSGIPGNLRSVGVFSNKRYIRLSCTSTGVTSGATITSTFLGAGEISPDSNLSA